jgi:signal transduction histidine kinase
MASILIKPIASLITSLIEILLIIVLAVIERLPVSIPSLFVLFLISIMVWFSAKILNNTTDYLKRSRKKYERAYQRINFYKDIFSHDIGNILQNLQSSIDLIKLYLNDPNKVNEIDKVLKIYNSQIKKAEKLISNVKKISQIEEHQIDLRPVDSLEVLNKSIKHIKSFFKSRKIEFKIIPIHKNDKLVKANDLLFDVFDNILRNAIIYNKSSIVKITIRFSELIENKTTYIKIEFMDNGMGIPDVRKKSIFERGDVKIEKARGIGVGLPFCKMIIDLFKGKIWVEDRIEGNPEKGTNFIVMIPRA